MDRCVFDKREDFYSALTEKICDGCKFRKTEKEFKESLERAEMILAHKGLMPLTTTDENGKNIVSVQQFKN